MKKNIVLSLIGAAGLASTTSTVLAQSSTVVAATNQIWQVQWVVDQAGPYAEGATATMVGITLRARVRTVSTTGQQNLGVQNIIGTNGTVSFNDNSANFNAPGLYIGQPEVRRGAVSDAGAGNGARFTVGGAGDFATAQSAAFANNSTDTSFGPSNLLNGTGPVDASRSMTNGLTGTFLPYRVSFTGAPGANTQGNTAGSSVSNGRPAVAAPVGNLPGVASIGFSPMTRTGVDANNYFGAADGSNNRFFAGTLSNVAALRSAALGAAGVATSNATGGGTLVAGTDYANAATGDDWAYLYRMYYVPAATIGNALQNRVVTVNVPASFYSFQYIYGYSALMQVDSARARTAIYQGNYVFEDGTGGDINARVPTSFTFHVPTPGTATLAGLAGIAALRRRRA